MVFTILHAGGKFGGGGYKVSGGLHGVGASVVNALSTWLEVDIYHEGQIYNQRYERGKVCYPLKVVGKCDPDKTGTKVTFQPDPEIFTDSTVYDFDTLKKRMREMAFLTKGLNITLTDKRDDGGDRVESFYYEGGIKEYVKYLNEGTSSVLYDKIMYFEGKKENVYVEVAMQHNNVLTVQVFPESLPTVPTRIPRTGKFTSSREIPQEAPQRVQDQEQHRLYFLFEERYLMLRKQDLTKYLPMPRSKQ